MLAKSRGIDLSLEYTQTLLRPILSAQPYPEVAPALQRLRDADFTVIALANSTHKALETQLTNAKLTPLFDDQYSIESIGLYKPHLDVYDWAAKKAEAEPQDCMLIAAHAWDIVGAQRSGMQTAFIARPDQELYPLAPEPDIVGDTLKEVAQSLLTNI